MPVAVFLLPRQLYVRIRTYAFKAAPYGARMRKSFLKDLHKNASTGFGPPTPLHFVPVRFPARYKICLLGISPSPLKRIAPETALDGKRSPIGAPPERNFYGKQT